MIVAGSVPETLATLLDRGAARRRTSGSWRPPLQEVMRSMLKRHAIQTLAQAGIPTGRIAEQVGIPERSVRRIVAEPPVVIGTVRYVYRES